ncbi:Uncharacterised protein [Klebsiella pneumoniae]|nr:Uncharacterised protein [Klebsiella pneumoniae]
MHDFRGTDNGGAKDLRNGLVTQADAQNRQFARIVLDYRQRDAGLRRGTRPGRNHDFLRCQRVNVIQRDLIVTADNHLCPQLAKILVEVPGKGIIVINQQNHGGS